MECEAGAVAVIVLPTTDVIKSEPAPDSVPLNVKSIAVLVPCTMIGSSKPKIVPSGTVQVTCVPVWLQVAETRCCGAGQGTSVRPRKSSSVAAFVRPDTAKNAMVSQ